MAEMSRRFNFDDFDKQIADALEEHDRLSQDARMAVEDEMWAEEKKWGENNKRPSEIGGVAITPLYIEWFGDELPPDDAA